MNRKTKTPKYGDLMKNGVSTSSTPNMQVIEQGNRKYVCKRENNQWKIKGSYDATLPIEVGVIK